MRAVWKFLHIKWVMMAKVISFTTWQIFWKKEKKKNPEMLQLFLKISQLIYLLYITAFSEYA